MAGLVADGKIPTKLGKEPLIEVLWEVRFKSEKAPAFELLFGAVYKALSGKYPEVVRLATADIPTPVREFEVGLRYAPRIRLEGGGYAIQIGERSVSLSCRRPYSGWASFSQEVQILINVLSGAGLIDHMERFSLKYIDLIDLGHPPDLSCLNIELELGGLNLDARPVQLRSEIKERDLVHIVHIFSPAQVVLPDSQRLAGVLLDIDTILNIENGGAAWEIINNRLDDVHSATKRMFFKLLTPGTIKELEPIYEG